ncbi:hypothetical protein BY996DRAFT_6482250 [Phakopsora pachyrhizi]|nr:hypothetical protein BY996DRAFT_6482250 [Phakopsora pachyrhizi]
MIFEEGQKLQSNLKRFRNILGIAKSKINNSKKVYWKIPRPENPSILIPNKDYQSISVEFLPNICNSIVSLQNLLDVQDSLALNPNCPIMNMFSFVSELIIRINISLRNVLRPKKMKNISQIAYSPIATPRILLVAEKINEMRNIWLLLLSSYKSYFKIIFGLNSKDTQPYLEDREWLTDSNLRNVGRLDPAKTNVLAREATEKNSKKLLINLHRIENSELSFELKNICCHSNKIKNKQTIIKLPNQVDDMIKMIITALNSLVDPDNQPEDLSDSVILSSPMVSLFIADVHQLLSSWLLLSESFKDFLYGIYLSLDGKVEVEPRLGQNMHSKSDKLLSTIDEVMEDITCSQTVSFRNDSKFLGCYLNDLIKLINESFGKILLQRDSEYNTDSDGSNSDKDNCNRNKGCNVYNGDKAGKKS